MTVGAGAASPPSPQSTCAPSQPPKQTQAEPIHQISKRTPAPASAARHTPSPPPRIPPELASVTAPVDARWRLPARQRAGSGFLCSRHQVFPKSSPRGPPRPGAGGRRLPRPGDHQAGRGGEGPVASGALRKAQCRGPSSRAGERQRSPARGARAGAARGAARGWGARGRQAAVITWPAWFSPSPGGRAGGRGVS